MDPPGFDFLPDIVERQQPVLVEALGAKPTDARVRRWCERRGIWDVIPQRSDQLASDGRRVFGRAIYKGRNVVERCVGWLKHNRRLGTRYEKLAAYYLAMLKLAFLSRNLRLLEP